MSSNNSLSSKDAKKLAKRLKIEDPDQFQTLVRMHLSFVLDLNVDESENLVEKSKNRTAKWGLAPFKKSKGTNKCDGESLTDELVSQFKILVDYLNEDDNLQIEGIFRRSGKLSRQQELKSLLAKGKDLNLNDSQYSVHDCASVLKTLLSELPEPLLTDAHHPAYCHIADLSQNKNWCESHMLTSIQLLVQLLPHRNQCLLKLLIDLLSKTASLEESNRMSPENLATLFTPHLLCPRKLSAEVFHDNSKTLFCIVVYMINEGKSIFEVPLALFTDIVAYWDQKNKNPASGGSEGAAKTVFSFVDRERTAQENAEDATETALAQLYAHIQSLPESNKKKRLIKQFNKENGYSTPRSKSITYSIRKHIFTKCKGKDLDDTVISTSTPVLQSCKIKTSLDKVAVKEEANVNDCLEEEEEEELGTYKEVLISSTPGSFRTPSPRNFVQTEMSPITRSTQRMPKAMQEAMVTPRSRKPVIALSGSNLCQLNASNDLSWPETMSSESLTTEFKDYLYSRSVVASSPADLSFSSQAGDFDDTWPNSDSELSPAAKRRCSDERPPITESSL